jgi:flagellar protein FliS
MFDMAIEYVNEAIHAGDEEEYHRNVKQAKRVVDELCRGLDMQYEISGQLLRVYVAMMRFLVKAGAGDVEKLDTVLHMLSSLRKSFYEVSKQDTTGPLMKNTQQVFAGLTYSSMGTSTEISSDSGKNRGFTV